MPSITFEATPRQIDDWTIVHLPKDASAQLPSRGLAMIKGTINGHTFQTALEPDGMGSHWFQVTDSLSKEANVTLGEVASLEVESTKDWPEPDVPADIAKALETHPDSYATWAATTPLAHWEWIRWIRATNRDETRAKRIEVACSKLQKGMRRPCCFNAAMCTIPEVSKGGVLLEPAQVA